jgi:hypothetical protein
VTGRLVSRAKCFVETSHIDELACLSVLVGVSWFMAGFLVFVPLLCKYTCPLYCRLSK